MKLAFKYRPYLPLLSLTEEGRKQKNNLVLWNFKIKFFFPSTPRSYLVKDGGQKSSILQNPRLDGVSPAKHLGPLVHPRELRGPGTIKHGRSGERLPRAMGALLRGDTGEASLEAAFAFQDKH